MHNCEEFRERIVEHIIDATDLPLEPRFQHELLICPSCAEFYTESCEMIDAVSSVDPEISEARLDAMMVSTGRQVLQLSKPRRRHWGNRQLQLAAAAALLLITVAVSRVPTPKPATPRATYVEQAVSLDPVTIDFLQQSELLLRNVMKITPSDTEDLADVKKAASEQLLSIDQRKDAAAPVPPVVSVMDTYETVLRDIRNVDERSAADDISDIKSRIQNNALIANIKAFQPRVSTVSFGLQ